MVGLSLPVCLAVGCSPYAVHTGLSRTQGGSPVPQHPETRKDES
jgi:hypothetical protein